MTIFGKYLDASPVAIYETAQLEVLQATKL